MEGPRPDYPTYRGSGALIGMAALLPVTKGRAKLSEQVVHPRRARRALLASVACLARQRQPVEHLRWGWAKRQGSQSSAIVADAAEGGNATPSALRLRWPLLPKTR